MKNLLWRSGILFLLLFTVTWGQARDNEAAHLQAFYLSGELMDYGNRVNSARAFLMAAELMLEHPVNPLKAKVEQRGESRRTQVLQALVRPSPLDLVLRAQQSKSFRAPGIREWAKEISERSENQVRALGGDYVAGTLVLAPASEQRLSSTFRANRLSRVVTRTAEGEKALLIEVLDRNGRVVARGESAVSFTLQRERKLQVRILNQSQHELSYELLLR